MPPSLLITTLLSIFLINKKIIYTSHNDEPFLPLGFLDSILSKYILKKPEKIISITPSVKNYLVEKLKLLIIVSTQIFTKIKLSQKMNLIFTKRIKLILALFQD